MQDWLWTQDGVAIAARFEPAAAGAAAGGEPAAGGTDLCFVVVHGFTGHLDRPAIRSIARELTAYGAVITFDLRGHGRSGGECTVGRYEVLDLAAAVDWATRLGHRRVVTVGWSLGAAVVVQHAAPGANPGGARPGVPGEVSAVVAVSGPSCWYYRGTRPMRLLHHAVERRVGRAVLRHKFGTRVCAQRWVEPLPDPPDVVASRIEVPLLIVHGDRDHYFPLDHAHGLADAAPGAELWIEPGYGHAENAATAELVGRIGAWAQRASPRG